MIYYAIEHIPTGRLLPQAYGRGGRGGTHVEFGDYGLPRLFYREQDAKVSLTNWLKGITGVSRTYDSFYGEVDETWYTKPQAHRIKSECRVIAMKLEKWADC